jgi:NTP pyrophosphatase (non-canonical NTP hydrolase)
VNLNSYAVQSHEDNIQWWRSIEDGSPLERNKGELMMLMVSEIAEAMEGVRKGLMDDKLPHRTMEEVELADCLIRIFDYAGAYELDLEGAYQEKRMYNKQRQDHKHEARAAAGGKKW